MTSANYYICGRVDDHVNGIIRSDRPQDLDYMAKRWETAVAKLNSTC